MSNYQFNDMLQFKARPPEARAPSTRMIVLAVHCGKVSKGTTNQERNSPSSAQAQDEKKQVSVPQLSLLSVNCDSIFVIISHH